MRNYINQERNVVLVSDENRVYKILKDTYFQEQQFVVVRYKMVYGNQVNIQVLRYVSVVKYDLLMPRKYKIDKFTSVIVKMFYCHFIGRI